MICMVLQFFIFFVRPGSHQSEWNLALIELFSFRYAFVEFQRNA